MSDFKEPRDGRFIASAVFIGLIVIAGIIVVILRLVGGGGEDKGTTAEPTSTTSKGSSTSSACGIPDGDQEIPTTAPATKWYFVARIAAPSNPQIGPAKRGERLSTCFARSPIGATFAAATLVAETFEDDKPSEAAARARMVPNDALKAALANPGKDRFPSQIVGFKTNDYTRDRASVTIASRLSAGPDAGALGALTMTMVWREGDWWWELQPTTSATAIATLEGFVPWSAVS